MTINHTYLALGDSMSIDDYTGVPGGGAVNQFFRSLGDDWELDDRTFDGCRMDGVPRDGAGDLVTLTIGGNDLLWHKEKYLREGVGEFAAEHLELLQAIRTQNPRAVFIIGDVYAPAAPLAANEVQALAAANAAIRANCQTVDGRLAAIHAAFRGREETLLCLGIEPTLAGAKVIAGLFEEARNETLRSRSS